MPGRAMALAPLAGLIPGSLAALAALLGALAGLGPAVIGVLVVGILALATRGLHLDGLADTADGLAASYDRERALAVMRSGDTGPTGLAAVVLVLLLQAAAIAQAVDGAALGALSDPATPVTGGDDTRWRVVAVVLVIAVAGRVTIPIACARGVPSARPSGLGATVAGSVSRRVLAVVVVAAGTLCALVGALGGLPWWAGAAAVVLAGLVAGLLVRRAVRRLGGITGDVIGAAVETGTAAAALVLAAAS